MNKIKAHCKSVLFCILLVSCVVSATACEKKKPYDGGENAEETVVIPITTVVTVTDTAGEVVTIEGGEPVTSYAPVTDAAGQPETSISVVPKTSAITTGGVEIDPNDLTEATVLTEANGHVSTVPPSTIKTEELTTAPAAEIPADKGAISILAERNGEELTVNIYMYKNPGIIAYVFGVNYDNTVLELTAADGGDKILSAGGRPAFSKKIDTVPYRTLADIATSHENVINTGSLMTMHFKVIGAAGSSTNISVEGADFLNVEMKTVDIVTAAPYVFTVE
ncbi:MAG: hypothetical protein LBN42_04805 [Oscillospiraceae bacterium]|nr:hypothetical protein [Oscillospiraceae bacterium]